MLRAGRVRVPRLLGQNTWMIRRWGALAVVLVVFSSVLVAPPPAGAATTGTIRVTVTTAPNATSLKGNVTAYGVTPGTTPTLRGYYRGFGDVSLSGLKPGAYLVLLEPSPGSPYAPEFYDNTPIWWEPAVTVVWVYPAYATPIEIKGTGDSGFKGTVDNGHGSPIPNVTVTAFDPQTGWEFSDKTNSSGNFSIRGAPRGKYLIAYDPTGQHAYSFYDNSPLGSEATYVRVGTNEDATHLDASLGPDATIAGTRGWPGSGYTAAYTADGWFTWMETDAAGPYKIGHLPAGDYRVGFFPYSPGFLEGWQDDAPSLARSAQLNAVENADLTGIDGAPRSVPCDRTAAPAFPDVPTSHLFCYDINWLQLAGITGGFPDGKFHPNDDVTRQSMAAFLSRYPTDMPPATPVAAPFPDVPLSHPFATEISWLDSTGITGGYDDGTFRPGDKVSRQAMAAFLYRLAGEPTFTPIPAQIFSDVPKSHPFFKEIMWLWESGIADGRSDGSFGATDPVSRQAMAAFLHRYDLSVGGPGPGVDPRVAGSAPVGRSPVPPPSSMQPPTPGTPTPRGDRTPLPLPARSLLAPPS